MKKKAFTLVELMVVVIAMGIIMSFAYGTYSSYQNRTQIMVDQENLKILAAAIRIQATETGTVAGSLSELTPENIGRAYVQLFREGRPYTMLAHLKCLWNEWCGVPTAEALVPAEYYGKQLKTILCPSDATPPTGFTFTNGHWVPTGGISYEMPAAGVNSPRGKSLSWLMDSANGTQTLLYESDVPDGSVVAFRHQGTVSGATAGVAVGIRLNGRTFLQNSGGQQGDPGGGG